MKSFTHEECRAIFLHFLKIKFGPNQKVMGIRMMKTLKEKVEDFEKEIGYKFRDEKLLIQALTHSSYSNERKINKINNYERLEFLGDAVLELISSHFLFSKYSNMSEGEMTKIRASMVCEPALAECARKFSLERYILLGKGEEHTGGRERNSIISDVMEAVIGALYLDGGLNEARKFVKKYVLTDLEDKKMYYDSKTMLQEELQKKGKTTLLHYRLIDETGPEHDKEFTVQVFQGKKMLGEGQGKTKKAAEQSAAYQALQEYHMQ